MHDDFDGLFEILMDVAKIAIVFIIAFVLIFSLFNGKIVHAAEPPVITEGIYTVSYSFFDTSGSTYKHEENASFVCKLPVYAYLNMNQGDKFYLQLCYVSLDGKIYVNFNDNAAYTGFLHNSYTQNSKGELSLSRTVTDPPKSINAFISLKLGDAYQVSCPLFDSRESLENYIATGDDFGRIYFPEDVSSATENRFIQLIDFKAAVTYDVIMNGLSVEASWSGLSGITSYDGKTETTNNSFVVVSFGFSTVDNPGHVAYTEEISKQYRVNDKGFSFYSTVALKESTDYLLYVKATPYHHNLDDMEARLYQGQSSYVYFNKDGSPSWSDTTKDFIDDSVGGGGRHRGTTYDHELYLSGVAHKKGVLGFSTITWTGTTKDTDVVFIPEDDTLVVATYSAHEDKSGDFDWKTFTVDTTTIPKGSIIVNWGKIMDDCQKEGLLWDSKIQLTPCYIKNGLLVIGEPVSVNVSTGEVTQIEKNEDGSIRNEDVTPEGSIGASTPTSDINITTYTTNFISFLQGSISAMGSLPALISTVFGFLPSFYINAIGSCLILILIMRIIGR